MISLLRLSYLSYLGTGVFGKLKNHIINKILVPIVQITFFAMISYYFRDSIYVEFVLIGNAVFMVVLSTILGVVTSVARDREIGIMELILLSPINRFVLLTSKAALHILDGLFMSLIGFILIMVVWGVDISLYQFVLIGILLFFISISMSMLGIFLGVLTFIYKDTISIANFSMLILLFISGINFPTELLPTPLQLLSIITPLSYGVDVIRELIIDMHIDLITLTSMIVIGLIYFLLALLLMFITEKLLVNKASFGK